MLGFPLHGTTIGTHYSEGHRVRLTVHVGQAPDPTEAQLVKVAEVSGTENLRRWRLMEGVGGVAGLLIETIPCRGGVLLPYYSRI